MRLTLFVCGVSVLGLSLYGQTLGTITGEVRDASGAVIPNAPVTAANTGTNAVRNTATTDQGLYSFPALVPGEYEVKVETKGFRPAARRLTLQVQQTARVDFTLEVGAVTSAVEVSAMAALLTTENATVGTVIENRRIVDLPLNGRNFLQLVALSPNVSYGFGGQGNNTRQGGARMGQNMSVAGMRAVWNNYTLDGVANTDPNFNTYVVLPSVDMLQEFKVQTGVYPAEFGRAATQINVSTKGGSNQFHGTLYEFVRNDKIDAKSYAFTAAQSTQTKNPFQWNQYGFTLGGPVRIPKIYNGKDKLFFSSNYEWFRQRTRGNSYYTVPSSAMHRGDFSELLPSGQLWDPVGRALAADGKTIVASPIPGNVIPTSRLSDQAKVLWEFWPEPNKPSESATSLLRNYYKVPHGKTNRDQFHVRTDFVESSNSTWFGRYSWSDEVEISEGIYKNGTKLLTSAKQYMISNTRTLSLTKVNEFRFGINQFFNATSRELAYVRNVIAELKIPGLNTPDPANWGTPRMEGFPGLSGFGDDSQGPFVMHDATFQVVDNFSLIRGKHSFRFGAEVRRDRFNQVGNEFGRGSFNFQGFATQNPNTKTGGYSAADFYLGFVGNYAEAAVTTAFHQFRTTGQYYFFDDTWRVTPKLTINAGLRYELTPPWWDRSQKYVNISTPALLSNVVNVPDMKLHPTMVRSGKGEYYDGIFFRYQGIQVARDGRLGDRMVKVDYNDFAPRLGIAWSPTPTWSIRMGSGIFYSAETSNSRFDMSRNLAGRIRRVNNTSFPDTTMANVMGNVGQITTIVAPYTWAANYNIHSTWTAQYLVNIQRQLSQSTMVEVGYTGSHSSHLQGLYDANGPAPSADGSPPNTRAPFPEFGVIQAVHADGRGNYNGVGFQIQHRAQGGLTLMSSYTFSKSIDDVSAIRGQGDAQNPNDSRCIHCEKAVSGFNTPHRVVASLLYELPFGKGKKLGSAWSPVLNQVAGGWQVGSICTFQSGRPGYPYGVGGRSSLAFVLGERPDATGQPLKLPKDQRSIDHWFNPNAFKLNGYGVVGNAGRNVILGPWQPSWDFSAHKVFRIRESHMVDFRFEAFNFPNHAVLGMPDTSWGSNDPNKPGSGYDTIRGTAISMRQIQLGLKYIF